ncbi:YicC/YloC family endoribonuclease [Persicobacter psychrovividus]|uniref:YicC family protein n=1 Tax=Persicobacter psychrovividus TaxID=387638 RepID=A0ABN6L4D4_9BACT|nr:hypothetical protein PEPS_02210 [Persicobacter psychrovividus]
MIKSMTGYGSCTHESETLSVQVEIRTLNSKFLDVNLKLPKTLSDREIEVRNIIGNCLERGKLAVTIDFSRKGDAKPKVQINEGLFSTYFTQLKGLAENAGADTAELLKLVLQMPEVMVNDREDTGSEEDVKLVIETLNRALADCDAFRLKEGEVLAEKLTSYIETIDQLLAQVDQYEDERIDTVKNRLRQNLEELTQKDDYDKNRFEQEIIFYLEKYDINEEKVRLANHLKYFMEVLNSSKSSSNGKKLGFISQEIGREINTLGSKANHAALQRLVVQMKEELEKIKEQSLNIL